MSDDEYPPPLPTLSQFTNYPKLVDFVPEDEVEQKPMADAVLTLQEQERSLAASRLVALQERKTAEKIAAEEKASAELAARRAARKKKREEATEQEAKNAGKILGGLGLGGTMTKEERREKEAGLKRAKEARRAEAEGKLLGKKLGGLELEN